MGLYGPWKNHLVVPIALLITIFLQMADTFPLGF
jgi:hypothetical protein